MTVQSKTSSPAQLSKQDSLTIIVDVQDIYSEMDGPTRKKFDRDFERQISYMPQAEQEDMRQRLQEFQEQSEENRQSRDEYRQAIRSSVASLRDHGSRILWLTMGNESRLYPASETRDPRLLHDLHLTRVAPSPNDDIFAKRYMNAGTDISDVIRDGKVVNPELLTSLNGQRRDQSYFHEGILNGSISQSDYFGPISFRQHMHNMGVKKINLMGQMTEYCVTDNAINLAMEGMKVTIFPGLTSPDRQTSWSNSPDHFASEKAKLEAAFDKIVADPASRGFKPSDAKALQEARQRIEYREFPEFIASLPAVLKHTSIAPEPSPSIASARGRAQLRSATPVHVDTSIAPAEDKSARGKTTLAAALAANFDAS